MARQTWQLVPSPTSLESKIVGGNENLGFTRKRLTGGKSSGVELIELRCGSLHVHVIPTRGNGIWRCEMNGRSFGWTSPINGPVHPMYVPIDEPSGLGWLDGFDEMLVRCGLTSNGAPEHDQGGRLVYPLHGRIANLPADLASVEIDEEQGRVRFWGEVEESRFHFHRLRLTTEIELNLDSHIVHIVDKVTNYSGRRATMQMLYHNNFCPPSMQAGWRVEAPFRRLVPRDEHAAAHVHHWSEMESPSADAQEQVFFMELQADAKFKTMVLLDYGNAVEDSNQALGVSLEYDVRQLPCFTLWKNPVDTWDGYVAGLEPGTNFPNPRSFEEGHGRVVELEPGQSHKMELKIGLLTDMRQVQRARERVAALVTTEGQVASRPDSSWCF